MNEITQDEKRTYRGTTITPASNGVYLTTDHPDGRAFLPIKADVLYELLREALSDLE